MNIKYIDQNSLAVTIDSQPDNFFKNACNGKAKVIRRSGPTTIDIEILETSEVILDVTFAYHTDVGYENERLKKEEEGSSYVRPSAEVMFSDSSKCFVYSDNEILSTEYVDVIYNSMPAGSVEWPYDYEQAIAYIAQGDFGLGEKTVKDTKHMCLVWETSVYSYDNPSAQSSNYLKRVYLSVFNLETMRFVEIDHVCRDGVSRRFVLRNMCSYSNFAIDSGKPSPSCLDGFDISTYLDNLFIDYTFYTGQSSPKWATASLSDFTTVQFQHSGSPLVYENYCTGGCYGENVLPWSNWDTTVSGILSCTDGGSKDINTYSERLGLCHVNCTDSFDDYGTGIKTENTEVIRCRFTSSNKYVYDYDYTTTMDVTWMNEAHSGSIYNNVGNPLYGWDSIDRPPFTQADIQTLPEAYFVTVYGGDLTSGVSSETYPTNITQGSEGFASSRHEDINVDGSPTQVDVTFNETITISSPSSDPPVVFELTGESHNGYVTAATTEYYWTTRTDRLDVQVINISSTIPSDISGGKFIEDYVLFTEGVGGKLWDTSYSLRKSDGELDNEYYIESIATFRQLGIHHGFQLPGLPVTYMNSTDENINPYYTVKGIVNSTISELNPGRRPWIFDPTTYNTINYNDCLYVGIPYPGLRYLRYRKGIIL